VLVRDLASVGETQDAALRVARQVEIRSVRDALDLFVLLVLVLAFGKEPV